jgi:hypothetical protein
MSQKSPTQLNRIEAGKFLKIHSDSKTVTYIGPGTVYDVGVKTFFFKKSVLVLIFHSKVQNL